MINAVMTLVATLTFAQQGATEGAQPGMQQQAPEVAAGAVGDVLTASATVEGINREKRTLTLKNAQGKTVTVNVPQDVVAFDQVKKGDKINMTYMESAAISIRRPGEPKPVTTTESTKRTGGASPERTMQRTVTMSGEIVSVDAKKNIVKVKDAKGVTKDIAVHDPDVRARLKDLKPGDIVEIDYTETMAVSLEPKGK